MEALFLKIEPVCTQKEAPMEKMEAGEIHVEALRTTQEAHCTPVESGVITREAERARNRQSAENERHFGPTPSPGMSVSGPLSSLPRLRARAAAQFPIPQFASSVPLAVERFQHSVKRLSPSNPGSTPVF